MKVEVKECAQERKYPYLGRVGDDSIVLFVAANTGTCIDSRYYAIGQYLTNWNEEFGEVFTGSVTLSNGSDES